MNKQERNIIYKAVLRKFDLKQLGYPKDELCYGICWYFTYHEPLSDFPEIIKHKPPNYNMHDFNGYWFSIKPETDPVTLRRNILLQAIIETE